MTETKEEYTTAGDSSHETNSYPLGRWKAWSTVFGAFLLQLGSFGPSSAFGVFQDYYTTFFLKSHSVSSISWIGSVQIFLALATGFVGGKLCDAGFCRATLITGSTVFAISFFMLSLAKAEQYYQIFLSQGLGLGIGLSLMYIPTFTLVSRHFKSRKAFAMGVLAASSPLGGVIYSIMLNQLLHSKTGFSWGVRAAAFLSLGCFLIGHGLIFIPPMQQSQSTKSTRMKSILYLRDLPYTLTLISGSVGQLGTYFPSFYVQLFAEKHNLSPTLSFYSLAILNVAGCFGRVMPNYIADRMGVIEVFIVCCALSGFVGFGMLGCGTPVGLVLFCIFYGFFFGSIISLYLPLVAALAPLESNMGTTLGIATIPVGVASLIGSPMIGAIIGRDLIWWKGIIFASLCMVGASVIEVVARYIFLQRRIRCTGGPSAKGDL